MCGVTGAGKSVAATRLGELLGLPVHLVDEEIGWLPGWTQRPVDEQRVIAERLTGQDAWILDASYGSFLDVVLSRTQVVVGLDYSRLVTLARLIQRTLARIMTREPICNGNIESWSRVFSRDSIIWWHATSFRRKRNRMRAWRQADTGPAVLLVSHPRQLTVLLNELERTARVQAG